MSVFTTAVNCRGEPADKTKTGGWKAAPFIIVNEVAERMAFFSIVVSLKVYLTTQMNMVLSEAATTTTDWVGASHFLTIFGAFLADAYLGRYLTMVIFSTVYAIGMSLLTFTASDPSLRPPPGKPATPGQHAVLLLALAIIAFGTGGIKPCVSTFGADQFDDADEREARKKYSFFNWFFLAINFGAMLGIVSSGLMVRRFGWVGGFGVPAVMTFVSLAVFVAGKGLYRYQRPTGSPLTRFMQVLVAACRNHKRGVVLKGEDLLYLYEVRTTESDIVGARKLQHTDEYSFLDKAAAVVVVVGAGAGAGGVDATATSCRSRWRLCTVTQVEELKAIVRIFPIFLTTIALSVSFSQLSTFFIAQSAVMDRRIKRMNNYEMRPGSTLLFGTLSPVIIVPIYAKIIIPLLRGFTGHPRGITSLQRMGAGLFVSVVAMAIAAVVERKRHDSPDPASVPAFWLFPQTFLMGAAEVFTYVGQLEFFYDQATDGTRSICSALVMVESGFGHWISTILVKIVTKKLGWIRIDLNHSRLDLFYWLLTGINVLNLLAYIIAARSYKGRINDVDSQLAAAAAAPDDHVVMCDVEEEGSSRRILAAAN